MKTNHVKSSSSQKSKTELLARLYSFYSVRENFSFPFQLPEASPPVMGLPFAASWLARDLLLHSGKKHGWARRSLSSAALWEAVFPGVGSSELWQWVDGGSTRYVMDIILRNRHVLLELMEMDDVAGCRNGVTTAPASDPSMFMSSGLRDPFTGGVLPLPTSV